LFKKTKSSRSGQNSRNRDWKLRDLQMNGKLVLHSKFLLNSILLSIEVFKTHSFINRLINRY
jgi:hypothetical protein